MGHFKTPLYNPPQHLSPSATPQTTIQNPRAKTLEVDLHEQESQEIDQEKLLIGCVAPGRRHINRGTPAAPAAGRRRRRLGRRGRVEPPRPDLPAAPKR